MVDTPNELHHYTDLNGLIGIIENECFWASNALFLNDSRELEHALDAAEKAVALLRKDSNRRAATTEMKRVIARMKEGDIPDTYVVCLTSQPDNLGQWRGYGGRSQGVRLSFDVSKLKKFLLSASKTIALEKISYTKFSTAAKMRDHLNSDDDLWDILNDAGEGDEVSEIVLHKKISALLPLFKHISFSAEAEWRIIVRPTRKSGKFRVGGNKIIPYFEVKKAEGREGFPSLTDCITVVMVGPGFDQKLTAKSIQAFLKSRKLDRLKVEISQVPYRPSL